MTTLNELVTLVAEVAGVKPPSLHLPVWPFWLAGAAARRCARRSASSRRSTGDASTSTRRAARSTSRVRGTEIGYAPQVGLRDGIRRTLDWYRQHGWL